MRRAGLALLFVLVAGCTSTSAATRPTPPTTDPPPTWPTWARASPTTQPTPRPSVPPAPATTSVPATTTTIAPATIDRIVVVGDSIALQLFRALQQRSGVRGGPDVEFLLSVSPQLAEGWPEPLPALVPDPANTAIVASFGVWHAIPPDHVADRIASLPTRVIRQELDDYLQAMVDLGPARVSAHLLTDIDEPSANTRIREVNDLIERSADAVGLEVGWLPRGTTPAGPNTVSFDGRDWLVRTTADPTHFCPAAALVAADAILDDFAVDPVPITGRDVDELMANVAGSSDFVTEGC